MDLSAYRRETNSPQNIKARSGESDIVTGVMVPRVNDMDFVRPARRPEPLTPAAPRRQLPPLDMGLPGEVSRQRFTTVLRRPWWRQVRQRFVQVTAVSLVLLITAGGLLFSQGFFKAKKVFRGTTGTAAALNNDVNPNLLKGEGDGRINILILGRGGGNHDAPDLTDTMIVASVDPVNKTATLLSIPRDLWVRNPKGGSMKINTAWETGEFAYLGKIAPGSTDPKAIQAGFGTADQVVENVLGMPIHYNFLLSFKGFEQAIKTVGGVSVNVPADLVDPTMAWENNRNPVLAKAGVQQMDGPAALRYVRSRETSSDFARAARQRSVMMALKTKVDNLGTISNPIKISGLMNAFGNNAQTDLSLKDASRLYSIIKTITPDKFASIGLADAPNSYITTGNVRGQSVVIPKAGIYNYTDIQTFVRGQLKDGYIIKENARILVLNGTTVEGKAASVAGQLQSYGYNVIGTANAPTNGWPQTTLVDLSRGKDKYTKNYLQKRFNVKAVSTMPGNTVATNGAHFVIIIGSDEVNQSN